MSIQISVSKMCHKLAVIPNIVKLLNLSRLHDNNFYVVLISTFISLRDLFELSNGQVIVNFTVVLYAALLITYEHILYICA